MQLQSDPTILYGLFQGRVAWGKPILRSEIQSKTAHNTYVIPGLPPTPICNPGRAAIEATLKPAQTKELYFVADGKGGHIFAETLKDHNANVARCRQVERERRRRRRRPQPVRHSPAPNPCSRRRSTPARPPPRRVRRRRPPPSGVGAPKVARGAAGGQATKPETPSPAPVNADRTTSPLRLDPLQPSRECC